MRQRLDRAGRTRVRSDFNRRYDQDLAYLDGPLLDRASADNATTAMIALMMSGVVIAGLLYHPQTRLFRMVGRTSIGLLVIGAVNVLILFLRPS